MKNIIVLLSISPVVIWGLYCVIKAIIKRNTCDLCNCNKNSCGKTTCK